MRKGGIEQKRNVHGSMYGIDSKLYRMHNQATRVNKMHAHDRKVSHNTANLFRSRTLLHSYRSPRTMSLACMVTLSIQSSSNCCSTLASSSSQ